VDHRAEAPPFGTRSVNRLDTRTRSTRILTCPGTWIQPSSLWCRRTTSRAGLPQPSATISRPPSARSRRWRWPIPRETPLLDRDRAESDDRDRARWMGRALQPDHHVARTAAATN